MNDLELGYVAVIIDGEGCIRTKTNEHSPTISVRMTDFDVLEKLLEFTNIGTISTRSDRGKDRGWKPSWVWRVSGENAAKLLKEIQPYMSKRRSSKIDEVISVWEAKKLKDEVRKNQLIKAAKEYKDSNLSLRQVASKHGTSYETVRRYVNSMS